MVTFPLPPYPINTMKSNTAQTLLPDSLGSPSGYASLLGQRLRKAMTMHNLNQVEFAAKAGVKPAEINHWVSGRRQPTAKNFAKLIRALPNTRLDWLLTGENL